MLKTLWPTTVHQLRPKRSWPLYTHTGGTIVRATSYCLSRDERGVTRTMSRIIISAAVNDVVCWASRTRDAYAPVTYN